MKKKLIIKNLLSLVVIFTLLFVVGGISHAEPALVGDKESDCVKNGDCQLSDLMQVAITAASIILGLTGTVALVAFVYAGFLFLISAGSSERVTLAKNVIKGAIIGIAVVFLSFTVITLIFKYLGITGNWWESGWFK